MRLSATAYGAAANRWRYWNRGHAAVAYASCHLPVRSTTGTLPPHAAAPDRFVGGCLPMEGARAQHPAFVWSIHRPQRAIVAGVPPADPAAAVFGTRCAADTARRLLDEHRRDERAARAAAATVDDGAPPAAKRRRRAAPLIRPKLMMDGIDDADDRTLRSYKIRMRPDADQALRLRDAFAAARWTYNQTVDHYNRVVAEQRKWDAEGRPERLAFRDRRLCNYLCDRAVGDDLLNNPKYRALPRPPADVLAVRACIRRAALAQAEAAFRARETTALRRGAVPPPPAEYRPYALGHRQRPAAETPSEVIQFDRANLKSNCAGRASPDKGPVVAITWNPIRTAAPAPSPTAVSRRATAYLHLSRDLQVGQPARGVAIRGPRERVARLVADGLLRETALVQWDKRLRQYWLIVRERRGPAVPYEDEKRPERVAALDPGVRTFQTFYAADGTHGELWTAPPADDAAAVADAWEDLRRELEAARRLPVGTHRRRNRIQQVKYRMERLRRRTATSGDADNGLGARIAAVDAARNARAALKQRRAAAAADVPGERYHRRRRRRRTAHHRAEARLREWVRNAHYHAARRLLTEFDAVLAPIFRVQALIRDRADHRGLNDATKRRLTAQAHYAFRMRLWSLADGWRDADGVRRPRVVWECHEPGTSRTCGACGGWHANLGHGAEFRCPADGCGVHIGRDVNGARGNLLAALTAAAGLGPDPPFQPPQYHPQQH